jgi:hypothetical protein
MRLWESEQPDESKREYETARMAFEYARLLAAHVTRRCLVHGAPTGAGITTSIPE